MENSRKSNAQDSVSAAAVGQWRRRQRQWRRSPTATVAKPGRPPPPAPPPSPDGTGRRPMKTSREARGRRGQRARVLLPAGTRPSPCVQYLNARALSLRHHRGRPPAFSIFARRQLRRPCRPNGILLIFRSLPRKRTLHVLARRPKTPKSVHRLNRVQWTFNRFEKYRPCSCGIVC